MTNTKTQETKEAWGWNLYRFELSGERILLGTLQHPDGRDVMGSDMHEWMVEHGHYGDQDPDSYEWDGDSESVAIMGTESGIPDFHFEYEKI